MPKSLHKMEKAITKAQLKGIIG